MSGRFVPEPIARLPWRVMLLTCGIAGFGLVVLYSAAGGSLTPWALNQGARFTIFLGLAIFLSRQPVDLIARLAFPAYGAVLALLFLVDLIGGVAGGSQRWLNIGFMNLQPSELMKPAIVLALARFYALLPVGEIRSYHAIWPALAMILVPFGLVAIQPDLGTGIMILAGGVTIMFLSGLPLRLFVGAGVAFLAIVPLAFFFVLHDYQRNRVLIFLAPESDPLGKGYHITQSKIAIGSGGLFGKGFLNGSQSHLDYLPEGHTDFVFATMAEEWGLVGGLVLLSLFTLLLRWGIDVSMRAKSKFSRLAAAGLTMTIFFYVAINLMMVMGLAPVVGIPLPFMSYGGSSMMTVMLCIGMIMAFDRETRSGAATRGGWR